ncbi:MAG: HD domain-containing protein [Myxococcales bacterium]|nr:HD domain-containing protein [Myxococcales bacterium]
MGYASEESSHYGAGDDIALRNAMAMADSSQPLRTVAHVIASVGRGSPLLRRARAVARLLAEPGLVVRHAQAQCDTTLAVAKAFKLDPTSLGTAFVAERWDGKGAPNGKRGEEIPLAIRLMHVADVLETTWHRHGSEAALRELRTRRNKQLDPRLTDSTLTNARDLIACLERGADWEWFLASEPVPHVFVRDADVLGVAACIGRLADLKSVFTLGHSARVAELAGTAARALSLSTDAIASLILAGHLHDIGRMAIPNAIWDKPGPFSRLDREKAELHTAHTERILRRTPALAHLAAIACACHERIDGSGYHRHLSESALDRGARILAVADVATALGEERPHRPKRDAAAIATFLRGPEAKYLDASVVEVVSASLLGERRDARRSAAWPRGLTDREVEVLRMVAIGKTNGETASILGISARTVQNHLANAYDKLGVSSRGGAALFMMEQGLLPARA